MIQVGNFTFYILHSNTTPPRLCSKDEVYWEHSNSNIECWKGSCLGMYLRAVRNVILIHPTSFHERSTTQQYNQRQGTFSIRLFHWKNHKHVLLFVKSISTPKTHQSSIHNGIKQWIIQYWRQRIEDEKQLQSGNIKSSLKLWWGCTLFWCLQTSCCWMNASNT